MRTISVAIFVLVLLDCPAVQAQLFGRPRQVGRPLARQPQPAAVEEVGMITGSERFLRGNRGRASFVGADQNEDQSFVGSLQASNSGTIVSSTAGIEAPPDQSRQINRPLTPAKAGQLQLPKIKLQIGDLSNSSAGALERSTTARVQQAVDLISPSSIAVSVTGRTAILRGVVGSDEERKLAEIVVSFEPGISNVQNLLQLAAEAPSQARPLPPPR